MNFITADTATRDSVEAALDAAFAKTSLPTVTRLGQVRDKGRADRIRNLLREGRVVKQIAFIEGVSATLVRTIRRKMEAAE